MPELNIYIQSSAQGKTELNLSTEYRMVIEKQNLMNKVTHFLLGKSFVRNDDITSFIDFGSLFKLLGS